MSSSAFSCVDLFETRMAEFSGAKYGIAVASCTDALMLCCIYRNVTHVVFPSHTYISAVNAAIHAGATVEFEDYEWTGSYKLEPYDIWDAAVRMRRGMYLGGLHCVSFQARKLLPIGRGGMILTNEENSAKWFRRARYDGRHVGVPFKDDDIDMLGWNCYMTPDQAARGLQLLEALKPDLPDKFKWSDYPDLSKMSIFKSAKRRAA